MSEKKNGKKVIRKDREFENEGTFGALAGHKGEAPIKQRAFGILVLSLSFFSFSFQYISSKLEIFVIYYTG